MVGGMLGYWELHVIIDLEVPRSLVVLEERFINCGAFNYC